MARGGGRAGRHGQGGRGRGGGRGQPRRPRGRAYTRKEFETVFEVLRVWLPITAPEWMKCADLINQKLEQPRPWDSIRQKFNKLIRAAEPSGDTEPGWEVLQARTIAAEIRIRMDGSSGGSDDEFVAGGSDSDNDDDSGENGNNSNGNNNDNGGVATKHQDNNINGEASNEASRNCEGAAEDDNMLHEAQRLQAQMDRYRAAAESSSEDEEITRLLQSPPTFSRRNNFSRPSLPTTPPNVPARAGLPSVSLGPSSALRSTSPTPQAGGRSKSTSPTPPASGRSKSNSPTPPAGGRPVTMGDKGFGFAPLSRPPPSKKSKKEDPVASAITSVATAAMDVSQKTESMKNARHEREAKDRNARQDREMRLQIEQARMESQTQEATQETIVGTAESPLAVLDTEVENSDISTVSSVYDTFDPSHQRQHYYQKSKKLTGINKITPPKDAPKGPPKK